MTKLFQRLILFFTGLILAGMACTTFLPTSNPMPIANPTQPVPVVGGEMDASTFGGSRQVPFPPGELVPAFTISVEVADWARGLEAWQILSEINTGIDRLPEGREYACVRMIVVNDLRGLPRQISRYGFYLTGDQHVRYPVEDIVTPKPVLGGELAYGEQMRGWSCYLVPVREENLMVVVDLTGFSRSDGEFLTYIGLTEDASVTPAAVEFEVSGAGLNPDSPVEWGQKVATEFWVLRVLDVIRGEEAFEMILEANQFNRQPPEGKEYLMVYVEAAYFGEGDTLGEIDGLAFESFGVRGERYDSPSVVDPQPALDNEFYPGGRVSGWVVVLAGIEEEEMVLVYKPRGVYEDGAERYLSLDKK